MDCVCKFNKRRDLAETSQSGFVDLSELLSKGIIPQNLNVSAEEFNDIQDPKSIIGRPSDKFEAMTMAKELNHRGAVAQKIADDRAAAAAAGKS